MGDSSAAGYAFFFFAAGFFAAGFFAVVAFVELFLADAFLAVPFTTRVCPAKINGFFRPFSRISDAVVVP